MKELTAAMTTFGHWLRDVAGKGGGNGYGKLLLNSWSPKQTYSWPSHPTPNTYHYPEWCYRDGYAGYMGPFAIYEYSFITAANAAELWLPDMEMYGTKED